MMRDFVAILSMVCVIFMCMIITTTNVGANLGGRQLSGGGVPSSSCGPDTAPSQASSAGYTCETYRWGSGDTLSEVDTTGTNAPGFKWYLGTVLNNGYAASSSDLSFVSGHLVLNANSGTSKHGSFVINTCGSTTGTSGWNVGHMFTGGWYVEAAMTFDGSGFVGIEQQLGFYGVTNELENGSSGAGIETDDPDYWAFSQNMVYWNGGVGDQFGGATPQAANITVQTGDRWGWLATESAVSYWYNDVANGAPIPDSNFPAALGLLYTQHMCFGWEIPTQYPVTIVSVKVWQTPP